MASPFTVVETPAFTALTAGYVKDGHSKLREDLTWLTGRLAEAPEQMGDHAPGLKNLPLPVFKARCKDSCHRLSASAAWRVYYAIVCAGNSIAFQGMFATSCNRAPVK